MTVGITRSETAFKYDLESREAWTVGRNIRKKLIYYLNAIAGIDCARITTVKELPICLMPSSTFGVRLVLLRQSATEKTTLPYHSTTHNHLDCLHKWPPKAESKTVYA